MKQRLPLAPGLDIPYVIRYATSGSGPPKGLLPRLALDIVLVLGEKLDGGF